MSSIVRKTCCGASLALSLVLVHTPASADEAERQQAIEIGQTGLELYENGQYSVALERFRTAARISHSPVFMLYEARCLDKLGRLLEAQRTYGELAVEELPADAPAAWRAAISDGARELSQLSKRVPSVRLELTGAEAVRLKLDGKDLDPAKARGELWLDPGHHELEAQSKSGRVATARVNLAEGERNRAVKLELPVDPQPSAARLPVASPAPLAVRSKPATDGLGIVLLAISGVGLISGTVTGLVAASKLDEIRENCEGNQCRQSDASDGKTVDRLALASTIGFAVGGAALGAWSLRVILTPAVSEPSVSCVQISGAF
jgi:hypothetical protein